MGSHSLHHQGRPDLQTCADFCCTAKWLSYSHIYIYIYSFLCSFPLWFIYHRVVFVFWTITSLQCCVSLCYTVSESLLLTALFSLFLSHLWSYFFLNSCSPLSTWKHSEFSYNLWFIKFTLKYQGVDLSLPYSLGTFNLIFFLIWEVYCHSFLKYFFSSIFSFLLGLLCATRWHFFFFLSCSLLLLLFLSLYPFLFSLE